MIMQRILGIALVASLAAAAGWWAWQYVPYEAVAITASMEPELGLPVYAQFVVTQRLRLEKPAELTVLLVPMYVPDPRLPLEVRLVRGGNTISTWRLRDHVQQQGENTVVLPLNDSIEARGELEVVFDGQRISHEQREIAPRLFIESLDTAYPAGNYRIADNEKSGDVAIILQARERRMNEWYRQVIDKPMQHAAAGVAAGLLLWLVFMAPGAVAGHAVKAD